MDWYKNEGGRVLGTRRTRRTGNPHLLSICETEWTSLVLLVLPVPRIYFTMKLPKKCPFLQDNTYCVNKDHSIHLRFSKHIMCCYKEEDCPYLHNSRTKLKKRNRDTLKRLETTFNKRPEIK